MRVFITGIRGQLGRTLEGTLTDHKVAGVDLPECDVTERRDINAAIGEAEPDIPPLDPETTDEVSKLYIELFEKITGQNFRE